MRICKFARARDVTINILCIKRTQAKRATPTLVYTFMHDDYLLLITCIYSALPSTVQRIHHHRIASLGRRVALP